MDNKNSAAPLILKDISNVHKETTDVFAFFFFLFELVSSVAFFRHASFQFEGYSAERYPL